MHETDALVDSLLEHDNTPPFIAKRLIQRMVTSNPSPRYIQVVAAVFAMGVYDNHTYSSKYGCLAPTVVAIVLDREARSPILKTDPNFGQLREPLLKALHLMRSINYTSRECVEVALQFMDTRVGQDAFRAPSVFSFFEPDFSPDGVVADEGLAAPEAQLGTSPLTIGYLNGMDSLIEHGLTSCFYGFGDNAITAAKHYFCTLSDGALEVTLNKGDPGAVIG